MNLPLAWEQRLGALLAAAPYAQSEEQHQAGLLPLCRDQLAWACEQSPRYRHFVEGWPVDYRAATRLADLPFLPVSIFKADPPLALVPPGEITRILTSSATTGQQPSRIALDASTARRMTKALTAILRDFIGPARRPYLVIDTLATLSGTGQLAARGAAVQGLRAFASEIVCVLKEDAVGNPQLDLETLRHCADRWARDSVLVYGLTHVLWNQLVQPLDAHGVTLALPGARILHSGGWKRLQEQAVTTAVFNRGVAKAFGCSPDRVTDFYGLVENIGVVYPDCPAGNKHVPSFAEVIVRDPLTLEPVQTGEQGLMQVCSALPTSFPGFLLLTDDIGRLVFLDGCPCGRRGTAFRFVRRAPKADLRGCGNVGHNLTA